MRLLLVNYEFPPLGGGGGNATANIARELSALGEDVLVFTSAFRGLKSREEIDGYTVVRTPVLRKRADKCSVVEMASFMASGAWHLPAVVDEFRPEAMIVFFTIPSGPLTMMFPEIPYIVSLRGGDVPGFVHRGLDKYHFLLKPLTRRLWKKALAVVANSAGLRDLALKTAPDRAILVIPNGVDCEYFHPPEHRSPFTCSPVSCSPDPARGVSPVEQEPKKLLFAGRLTDQKGLPFLFQALGELRQKSELPLWSLTLVGDGPEKNSLAELALSLQISERINFAGWLSRAELSETYRQHDVFVLPSLDEGMPNVLLEAMASGLPSVVTKISGNEELVREGKNGFLVPPRDVKALTEALTRMLQKRELRIQLGDAAREIAVAYSWRSVAEKYLALCRKTI